MKILRFKSFKLECIYCLTINTNVSRSKICYDGCGNTFEIHKFECSGLLNNANFPIFVAIIETLFLPLEIVKLSKLKKKEVLEQLLNTQIELCIYI